MRGDLPTVAFRLMQQLPVHTHSAPEPQEVRYREGSGGTNRRGLRIDGREYTSINAARRGLKVGQRKIYQMIDDGTAELL